MRLILTILIFCLSQLNADAQQNGYLNKTCMWGYCSDYANGISGKLYKSHYLYFMNGDTTINAQSYYQLYKKGVDSVFDVWTNTLISTNPIYEYMGALREDTAAFFFIFKNDTNINKLVDFDIKYPVVPDMYANFGCNTPNQPVNYSNFSNFKLNGINRFKYIFNSGTIIEGVGTSSDFLNRSNLCGIGFHGGETLTCFSKDNAIAYFDTSHCKCNIDLQPGGSNCTAKFCHNTIDSGGYLFSTIYNLSSTKSNDSITYNFWEFGPSIGTFQTPSFNWQSMYWDTTYPYRLQIFTKEGCTAGFEDTIKIGTNCGFLPLKFINVNAKIINNKANIHWQTDGKDEVKYFIVQRSYDGNNFENIGKILPQIHSIEYVFTDDYFNKQYSINKIYYRIICIKQTGDKTYSNTVYVQFSSQNEFSIYPNPVKNSCRVMSKNVKQINVIDCFGKNIYSINNVPAFYQFNSNLLNRGIYFLKVLFKDGTVLNEKLMKE